MVNGVHFVEQYETEKLPETGHSWPQIQGGSGMVFGGLDDRTLNGAKQLVILDVHFISSLPVMPGTAYKAWVDSKPVQMVWGVD